MRVLIPLDNPGGGGIARVGRDLAAALSRTLPEGDELLVAGSLDGLAQRPNVRAARRVGTARGRVARVLSDQLSVGLAAREADLVHMPDAKAPLLSSRPFVLTVHDLFFLDYPAWFPPAVRVYKRNLLRLSLRRHPRLVICVSDYTRERLRAHHPEAFAATSVEVVHPGLDAPGDTPSPAGAARPPADAARTATGAGRAPTGEPYFLTVSAIEPRKNHLGLLSAFQAARSQGLGLQWKVVGRPQYAGEPILAALHAADGVDVVGRVDQAELEQLYRGARFVATPSFAEGFGFPPLEAMARGVPVVCANGSALDETVGEAAVRVEAEDQPGWTQALTTLAGDGDLRERLIAAGHENVRRFSWPATAQAHIELFRRALEDGGS